MTQPRPDLSNRRLVALVAASLAAIALWFAALPFLPAVWRSPGSPPLYTAGVGGAVLLLGAAGFLVLKRGPAAGSPVRWFNAHVGLACLGTVLVLIHSVGYLRRPPALLILALAGLAALGVWARLYGARRMAATHGTKRAPFAAPDPAQREALSRIIGEKTDLLGRLDPTASEATFSPHLGHWLRRPVLALRYVRLAARESALIGARRSVGPAQAWWRVLHLLLAGLFVIGLAVHIVTVTFFAGYVAEGGEITWWHLADWGG